MHQRQYYALAFLLVLLAAVAGAYVAHRVAPPVQVPRLDLVAQLQAAASEVDLNALLPRRAPAAAERPETPAEPTAPGPGPAVETITGQSPSPEAVPTPSASAAVSETATLVATDTPAPPPAELPALPPTPTPAPPTPTPTAVPSQPSGPAFAFMPAGAVRHSSGDCAGPSIRGTVRDAGGAPLGGVRIWRVDQWGNEQTVESKTGQADLGQYDFPLGDTPNVHYVQVVDTGGAPISPRVEVQHRQGDTVDATCHWLDWVRP